jgi:hypothetical protein
MIHHCKDGPTNQREEYDLLHFYKPTKEAPESDCSFISRECEPGSPIDHLSAGQAIS